MTKLPVPPPLPEAASGPRTDRDAASPVSASREERGAGTIAAGSLWDGRYQIERTIGEGGMGEVLLARDLAGDERPVALKVLQPRFREVATPYFLREFVMQRQARHPSIPRAHELGYDRQGGEEVPYFAMEYVSGVPLAVLLDDPLPIDDVWRWTLEVLQALELLHRQGYLHRDVKPGNILVDTEGRNGRSASLIDFGIAVQLAAEPEEFFIGTPEYSAPERMACEAHDPRSDLYSMGLIVYELLEGDAPWPGWDPEELWIARTSRPPPPITNPACPEPVRQLIYQMLAPDPKERPASAAQVIERLCQGLGRRAVIETERAFGMRLVGLPVPGESYHRALQAEARVLLVRVPQGHNGRYVLHEIADESAVKGVRVVRVRLSGRGSRPLEELEPALEVFRRLREARSVSPDRAVLHGLAGAAVMLTRLHRPTLLCIEGLQNADQATLSLLSTVFIGASNAYLNVVATVDSNQPPLAPSAFDSFCTKGFVSAITLEPLTVPETDAYLTTALGHGVLDERTVQLIHSECGGLPGPLIQMLLEAFRRGDLVRSGAGYSWHSAEALPNTDRFKTVPVDLAVYELISLLDGPLPAAAIEAYLAEDVSYAELLDSGLLAMSSSGWVACTDRDAFVKYYDRLQPLRRRILHQRLADALTGCEDFPGRAALIAGQLAKTARPAQAVTYLLSAADDAAERGNQQGATGFIDEASALIAADSIDDEAAWQWRVLVSQANLELGRRFVDFDRILDGADALFQLGVEAAHMATIECGLGGRIEHAHAMGDYVRMVAAAEQLIVFQHTCATPRALSLHAWARAVEAWSSGEVELAFRLSEEGVRALEPDDADTREKLLRLRAELAVRCGLQAIALRACEHLERDGRNTRALSEIVRAGVLHATWLRRTGHVSKALKAVHAASAELGARHRRGLNGIIELELAECHAALGQFGKALEHARRAAEMARRDFDPATAFVAESLVAEGLLRNGEFADALERLADLVANPPPHAMPQQVFEVEYRSLVAQVETGEHGLSVVARAETLASRASQAGDPAATMRAVMVATRVCLRDHRSVDALRFAEWLTEIQRLDPPGAPPAHTVHWLVACAHYQMRWFKSANILQRRAMDSLRQVAQRAVAPDHRDSWLRNADNALIGSSGFDGLVEGDDGGATAIASMAARASQTVRVPPHQLFAGGAPPGRPPTTLSAMMGNTPTQQTNSSARRAYGARVSARTS